MVYAQHRIRPLGFWNTNGSSNLCQSNRPSDSKKKNLQNSWICFSSWPKGKSKGKRKERWIPISFKRTERTMECEIDADTNCNRCAYYNYWTIDTGNGGVGNKRGSEDHPNYSIVEIGRNTEESPGDKRSLAVT